MILGGCVSRPAPLQNDLVATADPQLYGNVVGQITTISEDHRFGHKGEFFVSNFSDGRPFIFGEAKNMEHEPNIKRISNEEGYINFAYPEGSFEINSISTTNSDYPIRINFYVTPGEITNLGHIFLLFNPEQNNKYIIIIVDNQEHIKNYISTNYPEQANVFTGDYEVKSNSVFQLLKKEDLKSFVENYYGKLPPELANY